MLAATFLDITMIFYFITVLMLILRGYVLATMQQSQVKLTGELLWVGFVFIRDFFYIASFAVGCIFFIPAFYQAIGSDKLLWFQIGILILGISFLSRVFIENERHKWFFLLTRAVLILGFILCLISYFMIGG